MGHSSTRTLQRYVSNTAKEHKEAMDRNEKRLMAMLREANVAIASESKVGGKLPPKLPPIKSGGKKNNPPDERG
jgi:hypothetical protein